MSEDAKGAALITGAAQRIGRAIAIELARRGRPVAVHYGTSKGAAENTVSEIQRAGGRAVAISADLAHEEQVRELLPAAEAALGPIDCLINNAAAFERDSVTNATRASWDAHIETNLRAPFVLIQAMAELLPEGQTGNVINILDERVWNLTPYFVSYTLSKSALWTLTQTMALALAPHIRVNGIGPGPTLPSPRQSNEQFARQQAMMPLGRGATPEEICAGVRFILAAGAMTGQMIALDGGQHLGWAQPGAAPTNE